MAEITAPPGVSTMDPADAYQLGWNNAELDARRTAREEVLTMLEHRYMDDANERNSPVAVAILQIAREVAEEYRERGA